MKLVQISESPAPPGAVVELVRSGQVELRLARWSLPEPRGTVVICTGRGEFIEKYAEAVGELLGRGFAVAVFDWRGQGGSSRLTRNRRKGHVATFADYRRDLAAIRARLEAQGYVRPWFGLAHSMGGAIVVDQAGQETCMFDRLVLSAPMVALHGLPLRPAAVKAIAATAVRVGLGRAYVPGGSDRSALLPRFELNRLTSDPRRYGAMLALSHAAPEMQIAAPTNAWLHSAFKLMTGFDNAAYLRRIATPMLVVACGADTIVDTRAIERFAMRLRAGHVITVPHARHEILMERDIYREQFWAAFDDFIPGTAGVARPGAKAGGTKLQADH